MRLAQLYHVIGAVSASTSAFGRGLHAPPSDRSNPHLVRTISLFAPPTQTTLYFASTPPSFFLSNDEPVHLLLGLEHHHRTNVPF
ncbi:unnamed protein product [Protopolystoma xenopodis]|uniref:Uncharacterized protein n=1 Tax=Protopolystoma xenopodis TaxID=117903 RepID=A0A448WUU4_9PLAT|nr:unnamed protein product [Protopolystoma xenopodis]